MKAFFSTNTPMQSLLWPKENHFFKQAFLMITAVIVIAISAQLSIPLQPVPLTFQSTTVILIGMLYGARLGTYAIAAYLLAGLIGLPVYADFSAGIPVFFGPTCGYLISFLPAAFLSGYLAEKGWANTKLKSFVAACLGSCVIFLLGPLMLAQFIGWQKAIAFGITPFILTEPIKLLAISMLIPFIWKKS